MAPFSRVKVQTGVVNIPEGHMTLEVGVQPPDSQSKKLLRVLACRGPLHHDAEARILRKEIEGEEIL